MTDSPPGLTEGIEAGIFHGLSAFTGSLEPSLDKQFEDGAREAVRAAYEHIARAIVKQIAEHFESMYHCSCEGGSPCDPPEITVTEAATIVEDLFR